MGNKSGKGKMKAWRISTDELLERIHDPQTRIIDVRSVDAYNGWREKGEARGGT